MNKLQSSKPTWHQLGTGFGSKAKLVRPLKPSRCEPYNQTDASQKQSLYLQKTEPVLIETGRMPAVIGRGHPIASTNFFRLNGSISRPAILSGPTSDPLSLTPFGPQTSSPMAPNGFSLRSIGDVQGDSWQHSPRRA